MKEHVGKTTDELTERLARKPRLRMTSTFPDKPSAERVIEEVFRANRSEISTWLRSGGGKEAFGADLGRQVGQVLVRATGETLPATKARIVLIRDETMPDGWRLLTSYPDL